MLLGAEQDPQVSSERAPFAGDNQPEPLGFRLAARWCHTGQPAVATITSSGMMK